MKIQLNYDYHPEDPRECMGYQLFSGYRRIEGDINAEGGHESLEAEFEARVKDAISVPVYIYIHSGMTVRTYPFECPWDSAQLGYLFLTRKDARDMFGWKRITRKREEWLEERLRDFVNNEWDDYIRGECYMLQVDREDGDMIDHHPITGTDIRKAEEWVSGEGITPEALQEAADNMGEWVTVS